MLQIISGKFYKTDNRNHNDCKSVLFSNVDWYSKIDLGYITIESTQSDGLIMPFVLSYDNQLERPESGEVILIKIGDEEIVRQLKLILSFSLNAIFDEEKQEVSKICRNQGSKYRDGDIPAAYLSNNILKSRYLEETNIRELKDFFKALIGLQRQKYNDIINCLSAYNAAIRLLDQDFNVAYSMLVYCLESLSQKYFDYKPIWEDYEEDKKIALEKLLSDYSPELLEKVKSILLKDIHLKLSKKFNQFVINNLNEDFYIKQAKNIPRPIQKNNIERALLNAYNIRSKYAHMLQPMMKELTLSQFSKESDYVEYEHEVYFTFSGLLRVAKEVITNFVYVQEKFEKEDYNWRDELPGILHVHLSPRYWVGKGGRIPPANHFVGFISTMMDDEPALLDMREWLDHYSQQFENIKFRDKEFIYALFLLYNSSVAEDYRSKNYQEFIDKNKKLLESCCIANIALTTIPVNYGVTFQYDLDDVIKCVDIYEHQKYKPQNPHLPSIIETIMYILIANSALKDGNNEIFDAFIDKATFNCCGDIKMQEKLKQNKKLREEINLSEYSDHYFVENKKQKEK